MSESAKPRCAGTAETDDRFLQALFAAEELEKLGFDLNALRLDQIEELSAKFDLPPERRQRLLAAIVAKMGKTTSLEVSALFQVARVHAEASTLRP